MRSRTCSRLGTLSCANRRSDAALSRERADRSTAHLVGELDRFRAVDVPLERFRGRVVLDCEDGVGDDSYLDRVESEVMQRFVEFDGEALRERRHRVVETTEQLAVASEDRGCEAKLQARLGPIAFVPEPLEEKSRCGRNLLGRGRDQRSNTLAAIRRA